MNSYLGRLIDGAINGNLENHRIGNYRITPQHGNVFVYYIYKDNCHSLKSGNKRKYNNVHVSTITIDSNRVDIELSNDYLSVKELNSIIDTINNFYMGHDINYKDL